MNPLRLSGAFLFLVAVTAVSAQTPPPAAPVRDQVETMHGTAVHDPYRYMENLADPQVKSWALAQGGYTRSLLDRIEGRAEMEKRFAELERDLGDRRFGITRTAGGSLFYLLRQRNARQVKLAMREGIDGAERILVDPDVQAQRTGVPHAINWFVPSWDGKHVAYGMSAGGSEDASMYVLDTRTGAPVGEAVPRVPHSGVSWLPDNRTIAFNQLRQLTAEDAATEMYLDTAVKLLKIGEPADKARAVFGPTVNRDLGLRRLDNGRLLFAPDSPWVIAAANDTTQREGPVFVATVKDLQAGGTVPWRRVAQFDDHLLSMSLRGHELYYRTKVDAPRFRVMKLDLREPQVAKARLVALPPDDGLIEGYALARGRIVAEVRHGATIGLRSYAGGDTQGRALPLPARGAAHLADDMGALRDDVIYSLSTWTQPGESYVLKGERSQLLRGFESKAPPGVPELAVTDVMVKSHDGVQIPVTLIHRKDLVRDGGNPGIVVGYGSYGLSMTAGFNPNSIVWAEQGGVTAIANVRGSGVYGDPWRMAGSKLNKANTWKDGIAVGQYLVEQGYSSPKTLAVTGGSAGGIFAGRSVTAAPQLFAAAVIHVGLLDAVRAEETANGITNISEFGSVKDAEGFRGLYEMSTYHQVKDGVAYPAVMFVHGLNDPRVDPWNSFKTAARMQAASTSGRPVLLRVDAHDGHGVGRTPGQQRSVNADSMSFMLWQMGKRKLNP